MPSDTEAVIDLAAEYHDAVANGRPADLAAVCRHRPDLLARVQGLLGLAADLLDSGSALPPPPPDDEPMPETVGRYRLQYELGMGAFGVAFRASDNQLNRDVAVKLLRQKWARTRAVVNRFVDETRITAQLQHPCVPPVHEVGLHADGRPWMAMKLVKGRTLQQRLRDGDPGLNRVAVFEAVCQGLSYAHSKGVVHRDLKPENVMVGAFGEVQIMDWGLAKVLAAGPEEADDRDSKGTYIDEREGESTQVGTAVGSPAYMPPEQAVGELAAVDRRSDVFGLGAILCHLLTGKPPFVGTDDESARLMASLGKVGPAFARLDASGADPDLVGLCKWCLSPRREDRPADAGQVAAAVAVIRAEAEARARRAEVQHARAEAEARIYRRWVWLVLGVAVLLVGTSAGLVSQARRSGSAAVEPVPADGRPLAVALLTQLHADRADRLGPDHPDTLDALHQLALARHAAGGADEAVRLLEQAHDGYQRSADPGGPPARAALRNLAELYAADDPAKAVALLTRTQAELANRLGADHPAVLDALCIEAELLRRVERPADAVERLGPAVGGPDPANAEKTRLLVQLAAALRECGRAADARPLLQRWLDDPRRPGDGSEAAVEYELGLVRYRLGDSAAAAAHWRNVLAAAAVRPPPTTDAARRVLAAAAECMVNYCRSVKDEGEAAKYREMARRYAPRPLTAPGE